MSSLQPDPIYALVDCNNFYCSCERVFNPALEKKPMAVFSNNDGCIVARSNEIKALGIQMAAPMFQYKKLLEQKKAVILLLPDPKNLTNTEVLDNYKELAFIGAGRAEHTLFVLHSPGVDKILGFSETEFL